MRNLREILRLRLQANLSLRQIKDSQRISLGAVQGIVSQAKAEGLDWPLVEQLNDTELARLFYPQSDARVSNQFQLPDWVAVHQELKRKGVTKHLLWEEYTQQYPNRCYSYPQYCHLYQQWVRKQQRSMHQTHKAGDKLFVDYAGQTVPIVDGHSGEIRQAQIFVAVLGASNYTFCEATWTQSLPDWLGSHARAFEFIGGVPRLVVPDNLKSGVSKSCRYDPDLNPNYQQLAAHYGVAIMPARPYKPQDKAKAEVGVQIIERWILARLRHQTFFSLAELNHCIQALLVDVNTKPFRQLKGSRRLCFESLDQPALQPLPKQPYQYTDIKTVKVNVDYHIQYDQHLYSVPHHLVGEKLELHECRPDGWIYENDCASPLAVLVESKVGSNTLSDAQIIRHLVDRNGFGLNEEKFNLLDDSMFVCVTWNDIYQCLSSYENEFPNFESGILCQEIVSEFKEYLVMSGEVLNLNIANKNPTETDVLRNQFRLFLEKLDIEVQKTFSGSLIRGNRILNGNWDFYGKTNGSQISKNPHFSIYMFEGGLGCVLTSSQGRKKKF